MKKIFISIIATLAFSGFIPVFVAHADTCRPTDFTADEQTLFSGEATVLHWDSVGCDSARIDPAAYPDDRPPYGSVSTGRIDDTTVFTLTVYDARGDIGGQRFLTITIEDDGSDNGSNCRIDDFDADDTSIEEGDSVELSWDTTGCDEVKINQGIGEVDLDGSEDVDPNETTTYTLSAYDDDGDLADTDTVKITVDEDDEDSCSIDSFKADDTSIEEGDSVELSWRTTGVRDVDLSPGSGNYDADDEATVRPARTTTYTIDADCESGSDKSKSLTVRVNEEEANDRPQAITTVAVALGSYAAQLNGIAVPNTTAATTAWFEWGPAGALGYKTAAQSVSNSGSTYYNSQVSGLSANTNYFYRAVVQNKNGTAYGDIAPFRTQTASITPPTIIKTQTVKNVVVAQSAPSLLELKVESTYDRMCVGGQIDYTVSYRNLSSQTLKDTVLQITHQKEVTFLSSSDGDYDVIDRTITVELGSIAAGESGTILVRGRVNDAATMGNLTVMTATVVYTNTLTRAQENAIAYSLVTVSKDCPNQLGASAFGFGSFLPDTLIEWLLLILIILALIVLGRQMNKKKEQPKPLA